MRKRTPLKIILLASVLGACATSTVKTITVKSNEVAEGVSYYLPKQLYKVTVTTAKDCSKSMAIAKGALVADTSQLFVLEPVESQLRKDAFNFKTSESGLLTLSSVTSTGLADTILINTARALATFGFSGTEDLACSPEAQELNLDFADEDHRTYMEAIARQMSREIIWDDALPSTSDHNFPSESQGIFYRRAVSYSVAIKCIDDSLDCVPIVLDVSLPQASPIAKLDPRAAPFGTDSDQYTFKNGMLTAATSNRESELGVIATIPLKVAKTILEVPESLLTLRTKEIQAESALADAEVAQANQILKDELRKQCILKAIEEQDSDKVLQCLAE